MHYSAGSDMTLVPPQVFRKTEGIHRIGLAADRPAASDVLIGTLYSSTDTGALERSNGTTWDNYSGIGGSASEIAYTDVDNIFIENQTLEKADPRILLNDTSEAVDNRKFEIRNTSQELRLQTLNDAESITGAQPLVLSRNGNTSIGGTLTVGINIKNVGGIFPGRVDTVASQTSWYLGSHASYGLWSSTGFFATGDVWATTGYFERGRSVRAGDWTTFTPSFGVTTGTVTLNTTYGSKYTLIGKTCIISFYVAITLSSAANNAIYMNLPAGITSAATYAAGFFQTNLFAGGMIAIQPSVTYLNCYRDPVAAGLFAAGAQTMAGNIAFEMA